MTDKVAKKLPFTVVALGLTSFFTDVGSEMVYPMLPLFVAGLGGSTVFLGFIEGLATAVASLLKLASGELSDRVRKRKPMVVFGYGLAALARPLVGVSTAPWHVLVVRVTDRIGKGIRGSPRDVLIAEAVPRESLGRAFGFQHAMDHAGAVVGPLVAVVLLSLGVELRQVFLATLVPGALAMVCVILVRENAADTPAPAESERVHVRALTPAFKSYLAIVTLFCLGNASDVFLLLQASQIGVPAVEVALLWAVCNATKVVSSYLGGSWSDRFGRVQLVVLGWLVYAVTYLGFAGADETWHVWVLFAVYGVFHGLTEPAEKALVQELAPPALRGRAFGLYNSLVGIAAVPAGLLTGWLWQQWGASVALATGAALALISSLALVVWQRAFLAAGSPLER